MTPNVKFSFGAAILVSLISLKLTQNLRVIALDSDARLFFLFTLICWSCLAVLIVGFRLSYSGAVFAIFNTIFVPSILIALTALARQPLAIGIFSQDLEPDLKGFGSINNLKGPHDSDLDKCDVIVGRISLNDIDHTIGTGNVDIAEVRAMERMVMRGRIPTVSYHEFLEVKTGKLSIMNVGSLASVSLRLRLAYGPLKRLLDLILSLPVGLILLFLTPFIVAAIKIDTAGPALFFQRRFGFQGKSFNLIKFRTMTVDPDYSANIGTDDDYRITKVGAFLRKTRLDELPQFVNVVKGEMSWIGPRPETTTLARRYLHSVPYFRLRHLVRPGVTGWAQVHQGYTFGSAQFSEKVLHDLYYIKHFSPALDLVIVLKTIGVILGKKGAR